MPIHVVNLARQGLKKVGKDLHGSKVAVLGIAYKANISDTRESPASQVINELIEQGATVKVYDPLARSIATEAGSYTTEPELKPTVEWADCVIVLVGHDKLLASLRELHMPAPKVVIDTRNLLRDHGENCLRLGE
jgi:UDP-N-acetyl-D-glucosamine dehydrogenase